MTLNLFVFLGLIAALLVACLVVIHRQNRLVRAMTLEPTKISTVRGVARNTEKGAVVVNAAGKAHYIDALAVWTPELNEQAVVVTGCLGDKSGFTHLYNATWAIDASV